MTKNPILNALAAIVYIGIVATVMFYGTSYAQPQDTILAPIAMISLFTLSAAAMGYIFLGQPVQLYLDNNKKEAVELFVQTLAAFGIVTAILLIIFFLV